MARQKRQRKPLVTRGLVVHRLESVSKDVFSKYFPLITELIGSSPGLYALYDEGILYYVGKSRDLKSRVRSHLRDRHLASWTHFSLYLVRRSTHMDDIESLLVRVANPKGNRVAPRGRGVGSLKKALKALIKGKQREELDSFFGGVGEERRAARKIRQALTGEKKKGSDLAGLVKKYTRIYRTHKGREYKAVLTPKGVIKGNGKKFTSPTAAAKGIAKAKYVNGWAFWNVRNADGEWVKLGALRS